MRSLFKALKHLHFLGLTVAVGGTAMWVGIGELLTYSRNPAPQTISCANALPELQPGTWVRLTGLRLRLDSSDLVLGTDGSIRELRVPCAPAEDHSSSTDPPASKPKLVVATRNPVYVSVTGRLRQLTSAVSAGKANRELAETDSTYRAFLEKQGGPNAQQIEQEARTALAKYLDSVTLGPIADVEGMTEAGEWPAQRVLREGKRPRLAWPMVLTVGGGLGLVFALLWVIGRLGATPDLPEGEGPVVQEEPRP